MVYSLPHDIYWTWQRLQSCNMQWDSALVYMHFFKHMKCCIMYIIPAAQHACSLCSVTWPVKKRDRWISFQTCYILGMWTLISQGCYSVAYGNRICHEAHFAACLSHITIKSPCWVRDVYYSHADTYVPLQMKIHGGGYSWTSPLLHYSSGTCACIRL